MRFNLIQRAIQLGHQGIPYFQQIVFVMVDGCGLNFGEGLRMEL